MEINQARHDDGLDEKNKSEGHEKTLEPDYTFQDLLIDQKMREKEESKPAPRAFA